MNVIKAVKEEFHTIFARFFAMKLREKMFLLYIIGGILPMLFIGIYLILGTNRLLINQAKQAEMVELELLGSETEELLSTINTASKTFYFNEKLEEISRKQYREYQEIVNDYHAYTEFEDFGNFYNRMVSWVSIYLENDTIAENAHFRRVDEEVRIEPWYKRVSEQDGGAVWQRMPLPLALNHEDTLVLTRLLKTRKSEPVGVMAMYLRKERLREQLSSRTSPTVMVLNLDQEIISCGEPFLISEISAELSAWRNPGIAQGRLELEGKDYVITCYTMRLGESEDILQIVGLKAYSDILQQTVHQISRSVIIFFISVLLSVVLIRLFSQSFSTRVNQFRSQMQRAATGNFDLKPSLGGSDEISDLYGYLGTMIGDIQRLLAEIYQERLHAEQLKTQQREAEFKVLASQINPHFLYNTLETIRMKARINHQAEIEELVKMLAKILRKNLRAGGQDVSIREEVELVESYLKIQQYRFEERIQYQIRLPENLQEYRVLPLILQPIVENSIIHGLETKEGIGHILIEVERVEDAILIAVEDDGLGISKDRLFEVQKEMESRNLNRTHIGVSNVHQRLRLKYGENYGLTISSIEGKMTRIVIRIPEE
ncbi:MAG: sensor histidine kinase [Lachnospiraceae bacterium]|nr:sensor histidine kinase [Lachnospiraceae bacterium]